MTTTPIEESAPSLLDFEAPLRTTDDLVLALLMALCGSKSGFGGEKGQNEALIALTRKIQDEVGEALQLWKALLERSDIRSRVVHGGSMEEPPSHIPPSPATVPA